MRFQLGTSPPRGTVGSATFLFLWLSPFASPPRYDGGLRESFGVTSPYHSACVLLQFVFFRLALPPRWRYAGGF